jgi:hypothetical protein
MFFCTTCLLPQYPAQHAQADDQALPPVYAYGAKGMVCACVHIAEADGQALPPVYGAKGMYVHVCILLKPMVKPFLLSMAPEVCMCMCAYC